MKRKALLALFGMIFLLTGQVSALTPYESYTYTNNGSVAIAPTAAYFNRTIQGSDLGIGNFAEPSDIFIAKDENIYIADKGNNRIVILHADYRLNRVITGFTADGKQETFSEPQGVFVWPDGTLYVADTGNRRIVKLDASDRFAGVLPTPESPILDDNFDYRPMRLTMDSAGRIFVISKGFNSGILELDRSGHFVQCLGAPKVMVSPLAYFWKLISTEAQKEQTANFVPTEYNSLFIDDEDFVYATTSSYDMQSFKSGNAAPVRKLNAGGTDILRKSLIPPYGDINAVSMGEYAGPPRIVDVTCIGSGMYAILDANHCRVFVYNGDGQLLFEFGAPGNMGGALKTPTALEWAGKSALILDSGKNEVGIYSLTEYGNKLFTATMLHNESQYQEEQVLWQEVLVENNNNTIALTNLGLVAYRESRYTDAMKYFRMAHDPFNYSKAFKFHRRALINRYFETGVTLLVVLIAAIVALYIFRKKIFRHKISPQSYLGHLKYGLHLLVSPMDGYWCLTREGGGSLSAGLTILGGAAVVSLLQARFTGFIFSGSAENVNLFMELGKVIFPVLLFCICNWCVTSLMSGEGSFRGILTVTGYATLPLVLLFPFAILFSNIMTMDEGDFYSVFMTLAFALVILLIVCGNKQVHDYSIGKAMLALVLTVVVMLIVVFLGVLLFALMQQMFGFAKDIMNEITLRLL